MYLYVVPYYYNDMCMSISFIKPVKLNLKLILKEFVKIYYSFADIFNDNERRAERDFWLKKKEYDLLKSIREKFKTFHIEVWDLNINKIVEDIMLDKIIDDIERKNFLSKYLTRRRRKINVFTFSLFPCSFGDVYLVDINDYNEEVEEYLYSFITKKELKKNNYIQPNEDMIIISGDLICKTGLEELTRAWIEKYYPDAINVEINVLDVKYQDEE